MGLAGQAARVSGGSGRAGLVMGGGIIRIWRLGNGSSMWMPVSGAARSAGSRFEFLGTEDSEQVDWQVKITRIVWRRRRYRRRCSHPGPATVCAPPAARPVPQGLFTAGFLARLAYEKHVLGRPVHRIVQALAADGFDVAADTLCGALKQVAPLIAPWAEAIAAHGRQAGHVHADETSWQVFEDIEDKDGHQWWLWVFVTDSTTVFVMDTSRSAGVAAGQLGIDREQTALEAGRRLVISSDFHKAYQSLARIDGVDPLWCWAHIRRYFLRAGAAHPEALGDWCDAWTERIAVLYRAHHALAATAPGTDAHERAQGRWQRAFADIDAHRILQASDANLKGANLGGANLTRANFTGADLGDANIAHTSLRGANLSGANFTGGANLTDANLTGANLTGADLDDDANAGVTGGTILTGARFDDADLSLARWSANAPVPEGWTRDPESGQLERASPESAPTEAN